MWTRRSILKTELSLTFPTRYACSDSDPQFHAENFCIIKQNTQIADSDRVREHHHGYLDEHSKTVSARQAETFEVLSNQFALCCRLKPVVEPLTQKLSGVLFLPRLTR